MLRELQLDGTIYDKTEIAIRRIQTMAPIAVNIAGGFNVMVSGGKDSTVITDLALRSGVKELSFDCSWTGIEHPQTVFFLRREKARLKELGYDLNFNIPRDADGKQITMWSLIRKKGLPSRRVRMCCSELKESFSGGGYIITGVRWAESFRRRTRRYVHESSTSSIANMVIMLNNDNDAARKITEACLKKGKYILNPIIEWTDDEVWEYIRERGLPYNPLYDHGYSRVGCIGCPMRGNKLELESMPRWKALYWKAAKYWLEHRTDGLTPERLEAKKEKYSTIDRYKDIETYYNWWTTFSGKSSTKPDYSWNGD